MDILKEVCTYTYVKFTIGNGYRMEKTGWFLFVFN